MGLSASKRVRRHLLARPEFSSACNSVYANCLSLSQHAFAGVKPYQLCSAVEQLHHVLSHSLPLISKWVPHPPERDQVDRAFRSVVRSRGSGSTAVQEEDTVLDEAEFEELALEVFAECVASNMEREALKRVAVGAVGIGGVGAVVRPGNGVLVAAIAAYALGIGIDLYLRLDANGHLDWGNIYMNDEAKLLGIMDTKLNGQYTPNEARAAVMFKFKS